MLARAGELKVSRARRETVHPLQGLSILLYFEKPSLRTFVTFEIGVAELGAHAVQLPTGQVNIGEREPIEDVARNLSRWCHCIVARTFGHDVVEGLARWGSVPIVNGLTDLLHPCQALADHLTLQEVRSDLKGTKLTFLGDGNNVAPSPTADSDHGRTSARTNGALRVVCRAPCRPDSTTTTTRFCRRRTTS